MFVVHYKAMSVNSHSFAFNHANIRKKERRRRIKATEEKIITLK